MAETFVGRGFQALFAQDRSKASYIKVFSDYFRYFATTLMISIQGGFEALSSPIT